MSDLLSIGISGIRAYTAGMATVSDNIANAQTPGFARRTVQIAENQPIQPHTLYASQVGPQGARVTGVSRAVESWLIDDARLAGGDAARASARSRWLDSAETALGTEGDNVGQSMTALFNTADQLASDPRNTQHRAAFLQGAADIAAEFNRTASGLARAADGAAADAQAATDQLNADIAALASVNSGLRRARDGSSGQATLLDARDQLVDSIANATGITATYDARGAATIALAPPSGETLLDGVTVNGVSVNVGAGGLLSFTVNPGSGAAFQPATGSLSGLAGAAEDIADRLSALDTMAVQFANTLNGAHQAGIDLTGNPGSPLFDARGGTAMALRALDLDPGNVAAANATSSNGNALGFAALRGAGGGESEWAVFAAAQWQATANARAQDSAASTRKDAADAARADLSAVDLDREAADLLRFQQAYQGAARVLQVARETMQSVLSIF